MRDAKSGIRQKDLEEPPPDGYAQVEFDAGGQASFVNPNPVRPILEGGFLVLRWTMEEPPLHANSEFEVVFGNVVPCNKTDYFLEGLQSEPDPDGRGWTWRWPKPEHLPSDDEEILILYDVFFNYQMARLLAIKGIKNLRHVQTVSLRQILSTDPTLILPPKP